MNVREASGAESGGYSGQITQRLVRKAERLFGSSLKSQHLESMLAQVLAEGEDLCQAEFDQLREIAGLLEQNGSESSSTSLLRCDGSFEFTTQPDEMALLLSVRAPVAGGAPVTVQAVLDWLKNNGIRQNVDLAAIRSAVDSAQRGEQVCNVDCVRGRAPIYGTDARLEQFARLRGDDPLQKLTQSDLDQAQTLFCKAGDVVMRYIPPVPGQPGHTASGQPIPAPTPLDINPVAGKHIQRVGDQFITQVGGVVIFDGYQVEARKALVLHHDLTRQHQPIDFDGDVQIHGAVRSGVVVKATGNIIIDGPVEAAEIASHDGDVTLRHGIAGQQAGIIHAGRDIHARFAESATLIAQRNITLQVGSLHSRLTAHHQVLAIQGKGLLAGGVVIAGEKVRVKQLGARGGVLTEVTVGLGGNALSRICRIDEAAGRVTQRREQCTRLADQIQRAIGDPAKLCPRELSVYARLRQLQLACDVQLRRLNERRQAVLADSTRHGGGQIHVLCQILGNVRANIGTGELLAEAHRGACTLAFDERSRQVVLHRGLKPEP